MLATFCAKQVHVQILIDHGADVRAKDQKGWEVSHYGNGAAHDNVIEKASLLTTLTGITVSITLIRIYCTVQQGMARKAL